MRLQPQDFCSRRRLAFITLPFSFLISHRLSLFHAMRKLLLIVIAVVKINTPWKEMQCVGLNAQKDWFFHSRYDSAAA